MKVVTGPMIVVISHCVLCVSKKNMDKGVRKDPAHRVGTIEIYFCSQT
jgi:hypothetical protein